MQIDYVCISVSTRVVADTNIRIPITHTVNHNPGGACAINQQRLQISNR